MGLLSGGQRPGEPQLPICERRVSPTKERLSDDFDRYSSDYDSDTYRSDESRGSSRTASGSMASSRSLMLPKRHQPVPRRPAIRRLYPYRRPAKLSRYLCVAITGFIVLMMLSLIRASQVENWKMENGKVEKKKPEALAPVWEQFPFLDRYYGGIYTLLPFNESKPQYPGGGDDESEVVGGDWSPNGSPDEMTEDRHNVLSSRPWDSYPRRVSETQVRECFLDPANTIRPPSVRYFEGRPQGFPRHVLGSYDLLGLPEDICLDRFGRFGPYGFGYSVRAGGLGTGEHGEREASEAVWETRPRVDFGVVDWADVQQRCLRANAERFRRTTAGRTLTRHGFYNAAPARGEGEAEAETEAAAAGAELDGSAEAPAPEKNSGRTAVVVRCWDEYLFRADDVANLRAMITELAMASGGRYDVHLLVQVRNDAAHPVLADDEAYQRRVEEAVPREFRGLVTLWTETQMLSLYQGVHDLFSRGPELPVHGPYRGLSMAMQHFAYLHPEYDFFWQWEMDVRYTGHYLDLLANVERWAREQPRKGLWERNARFYLPQAHGSWEDFSQMARVQSEMGAAAAAAADDVRRKGGRVGDGVDGDGGATNANIRQPVWGPRRAPDPNDWLEPDSDPRPPSASPDRDRYEWGVGEEADFISFNPLFDPDGTTWLLRDDVTGFNRSLGMPPRRASLMTTSRLSRRLLLAMHRSTAHKKQFAFPEMWPATVALHHGFKAVFAPHPVYVDRRWPQALMAQTYNAGRDGAAGGASASVFGEHEHNMRGLSWFYDAGFAPNLYRRWMGLRVNNDGGHEFETTRDESRTHAGGSVADMPGGEGRMCLPPMLLHPVKDVDLPVEAPPVEAEVDAGGAHGGGAVPASDPTA